MKSMKLLFTLLFVAVFATVSLGQGVITASAHDFSSSGTTVAWNTSGEICIVCHAPHNNKVAAADMPLWNHSKTEATFILYDENVQSGTFNAGSNDQATQTQPGGSSKLCLSCHDGSINLGSFGLNVAGGDSIATNGSWVMSGHALVGTDLSNDHPISFTYDAALVTADANGGANGLADPTAGDIPGWLNAGKVECSTCHDVHNNGLGATALLRVSNAGSELCKTCHLK